MSRSRARSVALPALLISTALFTGARAEVTVEEFGHSIAQALQDRQPDRFSAALDGEALVDGALVGMKGNERFVAGLRRSLEGALPQVGSILIRDLSPAAKLSFLRARTVGGDTRILLRIDLGDAGLNYLDLFVHRRPDGSWAIFDWIDYVQGQTYTESLKMVLALMVREDPGLMGRLLGLSDIDREVTERIAEMGTLAGQRDWTGWLRVYRSLPEEVRNSRVLLATQTGSTSTPVEMWR